jgi:hypothetical protein
VSEAARSWQAGLRPWLVRALLRPTLLARDVDHGWIGDLLGRGAWAEQRLPLLASWTEQWSPDADDERPELPVVHARPLAPAEAPAVPAVVQVATRRPETIAEAPALPVAALRPLAAHEPASRPGSPAVPPAPVLHSHPEPASDLPAGERVTSRLPPGGEAAVEEPTRRLSSAELPRVVAAFQRDRPGRAGQAGPRTTGTPRTTETPRTTAAPPEPRQTAPTTATVPEPALPAHATAHMPLAGARELPSFDGDMPHATGLPGHVARDMSAPAAKRAASSSQADSDAPPLGASAPLRSDVGPSHLRVQADGAPGPSRVDVQAGNAPGPSRVRVHTPVDDDTALSHVGAPLRSDAEPPSQRPPAPAPAQTEPVRPHISPAAPRPSASVPSASDPSDPRLPNLSQSTGTPALPTRAVLRPVEAGPPVRARPVPRGEPSPPVVPAAWPRDEAAPGREQPGARRTELPHTHAAPPRADEPRPVPTGAAHSPVRTDISTPTPAPAAAQPPASPLDIEALIDTVHRRLARELGRARELRRTIR